METVEADFQPVATLRGSLLQAKGDLEGATRAYQRAGAYFTLGAEHLRTADGFMSAGVPLEAWQNAFQSKFVEPQRPEVHLWLSEKLREGGWEKEAAQEDAVARLLADKAADGGVATR